MGLAVEGPAVEGPGVVDREVVGPGVAVPVVAVPVVEDLVAQTVAPVANLVPVLGRVVQTVELHPTEKVNRKLRKAVNDPKNYQCPPCTCF